MNEDRGTYAAGTRPAPEVLPADFERKLAAFIREHRVGRIEIHFNDARVSAVHWTGIDRLAR